MREIAEKQRRDGAAARMKKKERMSSRTKKEKSHDGGRGMRGVEGYERGE